DRNVTGVQTCALPICLHREMKTGVVELYVAQLSALGVEPHDAPDIGDFVADGLEPQADQVRERVLRGLEPEAMAIEKFVGEKHRSEERRVGKECTVEV